MSDQANTASPSGQPVAPTSAPAATSAPPPAAATAPSLAPAAPAGLGADVALLSGQRIRRTISDSTRALFARAAEAQRAHLATAEQGNLDMAGGDGEPGTRAPSSGDREHDDAVAVPVRPAAAAGSAPTAPPAAPRAETPAAAAASPPPAPALDPALLAHQERLNLRAAELERRETAHAAKLAATPDVTQYRDKYHENPAAALKELVKAWTGATTDDELRAEIGDLVTELSVEALGLEVNDASLRTHRETKKALRAVKAHKTQLADLKAKTAAEAETARQAAEDRKSIEVLGQAFPTVAARFPFLAAEDVPQELIYDVLKSEHKATGVILDWTEAAKRADDFLKTQASAWFAKRKALFVPDTTAPPVPPAKAAPLPVAPTPSTPQGDPQGHRRSGEDATQGMGRWNRDAHRRATMQKYAGALRVKEE